MVVVEISPSEGEAKLAVEVTLMFTLMPSTLLSLGKRSSTTEMMMRHFCSGSMRCSSLPAAFVTV